jgi:hypothetical protein
MPFSSTVPLPYNRGYKEDRPATPNLAGVTIQGRIAEVPNMGDSSPHKALAGLGKKTRKQGRRRTRMKHQGVEATTRSSDDEVDL